MVVTVHGEVFCVDNRGHVAGSSLDAARPSWT